MSATTQLPAPARLHPGDLARVGLEGLRGRPLRAVLSAVGITIGVAAMVGLVGISTVSQAGLIAQIRALGSNLLTASPGTNLLGQNSTLPDGAEGMVTRIPGVTDVSAIGMVGGATVRRTDRIDPAETNGIAVQAARVDLLNTLQGTVRSGTFLNAATGRYPTVALGSVAADRLGIARAGAHVYIAGRWFLVIGVLDTLPLAPEIDRAALIGWPYASQLGFSGHPSTLYERSTAQTVQSVYDVLARTINPEHPEEVQVSQPTQELEAEAAADSAFNALFLGIGIVALLAGGIGIANVMVISVLERRQEIGLRRSLGATRHQIRMQFLTESVTLSTLGGAAGAAVGLVASTGYALVMGWPLTLPTETIAGGVAAAIVIGALAGLYPARRAARLTPTEALATT
ncbi:ABC transporter permease [Plantactinospora sp. S1510]|uniref:ABC transporter permease n=1 Tax=Plantactinospora alkalitolerans TaxID=2789879 RepID=A0ABS0GVZ9_9ACTN|nr:ABC transporter permease [Plantactinospora alkalitolerans]MBF9130384.1 ABC transporter permease [Plantactinospora alkalitolerans]